MKIALTVWGNRISPVFDSAKTLLVARVKKDHVIEKKHESFDPGSTFLLNRLTELDISVLICGAISEVSADLVSLSGIRLIPFVTGNANQVLDHYISNKPFPEAYFMPCCYRKEYRSGSSTVRRQGSGLQKRKGQR